MKKVLLPMLIVAGLTSCNTYNDKMNALLQNKSELESQITYNDTQMQKFDSLAAAAYSKGKSTKSMLDSFRTHYLINKNIYSELRKVRYSIDSLSRLK